MRRTGWSGIVALGAAVLLVACGGGSSGGSAASSAPPHSAEAGEPALIQVPGYEYVNLSSADAADVDLEGMVDSINAEVPGFYTGASVHEVKGPNEDQVGVMLFEVGAEFASNPDVVDQIVPGMIGGMAGEGATVKQETIEGETVGHGVDADGIGYYAWFHEGVVTMAFGDVDAEARAFTEKYLAEANA